MLLQASQTSSGMSPRRCRKPKMVQPRQNPANASRDAAAISTASSTHAAGASPAASSTADAVDTAAPMPWANRLGGPGTRRVRPSQGVRTLTESWARGEIRGPNSTRSQNPAAMTASPHPKPVSRVTADSATTRAAVMRAAYSFTGFGNANTRRQSIPRVAGADFAGADDAESAGTDLAGAAGACASVSLLIRQGYERACRGRNDCCAV